MKIRNTYIFIILISFLILSCENKPNTEKIDFSKTEFVYLDGNNFKYKGNDFFPIMLNYVVSFRKIKNEYVISSIKDYEDKNIYEGNTVDSTLIVLRGHMQLIKDLGFNSVRLVGIDRIDIQDKPETGIFKDLSAEKINNILINCLNQFLDIADDLDLKVMILLNGPVNNPVSENFTIELLKKFKDNSTIFAYDFINEPLYFDNKDLKPDKRGRTKESAYKIVKNWKDLMEKYAPFQLMTIGFSEPIEVFEWDPAILPVDFVAFHTYHPLRVPNEIYWYSRYVDKPWMIGETSLPADNDSISYSEQKQFLKETYQRIVNCGGAGIAWWSFQDVEWGNYEHNYTSIMNHKGETITKDGKYIIKGELKPVAYEFADLKNYKKTGDCPCLVNYYNMVGYKNYIIHGKIVNSETSKPVEGAVIRGWSKWWNVGANTFTDEDGRFSLFSNIRFEHFAVSAPKMSFLKFDSIFKYKPVNINLNLSFNDLKDTMLEYHSISYSSFLADKRILDTSFVPEPEKSFIFNFSKDKFNKAVFKADIGVKKLEPIDFN